MAHLNKLTISYCKDERLMQNPSRTYGWGMRDLTDLLQQWERGDREDIKSIHFDGTEVTKTTWRATALIMGINNNPNTIGGYNV